LRPQRGPPVTTCVQKPSGPDGRKKALFFGSFFFALEKERTFNRKN